MASNKLLKGYKYWILVGGPDDTPVNGMLRLSRKKPGVGRWIDVTTCLRVCCTFPTLTALDGEFEMTEDTAAGDLVDTLSAVSSSLDTITFTEFSGVINGVTVTILEDGTLTLEVVDAGSDLTTEFSLLIAVADQHNNIVYVTLTVSVAYVAP